MKKADESLLIDAKETLVLYRKKKELENLQDVNDEFGRSLTYQKHSSNEEIGEIPTEANEFVCSLSYPGHTYGGAGVPIPLMVPKVTLESSATCLGDSESEAKLTDGYTSEYQKTKIKQTYLENYSTHISLDKQALFKDRLLSAAIAGAVVGFFWFLIALVILLIMNGVKPFSYATKNFFNGVNYFHLATPTNTLSGIGYSLLVLLFHFLYVAVGVGIIALIVLFIGAANLIRNVEPLINAFNRTAPSKKDAVAKKMDENFALFRLNNLRLNDFSESKDYLEKALDNISQQYDDKIASSGIYVAYRDDPIALTRFVEYMESGRCESFTGHGGCYDTFETEKRLDRIVTSLDSIESKLDSIMRNQVTLGKMILAIQEDNRRFKAEVSEQMHDLQYQQGGLLKAQNKLIDTIVEMDRRDYLTNPCR